MTAVCQGTAATSKLRHSQKVPVCACRSRDSHFFWSRRRQHFLCYDRNLWYCLWEAVTDTTNHRHGLKLNANYPATLCRQVSLWSFQMPFFLDWHRNWELKVQTSALRLFLWTKFKSFWLQLVCLTWHGLSLPVLCLSVVKHKTRVENFMISKFPAHLVPLVLPSCAPRELENVRLRYMRQLEVVKES